MLVLCTFDLKNSQDTNQVIIFWKCVNKTSKKNDACDIFILSFKSAKTFLFFFLNFNKIMCNILCRSLNMKSEYTYLVASWVLFTSWRIVPEHASRGLQRSLRLLKQYFFSSVLLVMMRSTFKKISFSWIISNSFHRLVYLPYMTAYGVTVNRNRRSKKLQNLLQKLEILILDIF